MVTVLPDACHQFCHFHCLKNLAELLAKTDSAFNAELRKAVRREVDLLIRAESASNASRPQPSLFTVTGILPDHPQTTPGSDADVADAIVTQVLRHTRYLLTQKGRPLFRLGAQRLRLAFPVLGLYELVLSRRFTDYGGCGILGIPAGRTG